MRRILNILADNLAIIITLVVGVFLRFYKLNGFLTFLGDQGRDAIIVKRILTLEHFPAIGAPTSVGQVYLGPFYYYFITPWLWFFQFNPVGLAFGVAFFSSIYLIVNYFIVKELFDKKIAIISTMFLSFSSIMIDFSRYSWNPNLLPLFTLMTVYFAIKSLKTNKWYYFALLGAFISFDIQLHYLALFLIPPIGILYLLSLPSLKQLISQSRNFLISTLAFLFFSSPLIIFDLRHQFLNSKNFANLFQSSATSLITKINSLFDSFYYLNIYALNIELNKFFVFLLLLFLFIILLTLIKKDTNFRSFLIVLLLSIIGLSLYSGPKYPHYFVIIYPIYYIVVSKLLVFSKDFGWEKYLVIFFMVGFIFLNFQKYPYFNKTSNNQIELAQNIAKKIFDNVKQKKFTVTALPEKYSDSTYRYFLEIWGKRAEEKDSIEKTDELFVVCEKDCPLIIGNPQWDIAFFAPNKIIGEWKVEGVKIYKLIR